MKFDLEETKNEILAFLCERPDKLYTTTQITSSLGLKKEYRIEIQAILNELVTNGIVEKSSKRYTISKTLPEHVFIPSLQSHKTYIPSEERKIVTAISRKSKNTIVGRFDATSLAKNLSYAFVICQDEDDVFVSSEDTSNAYHGDTVEVEVTSFRHQKRYGTIKKIIKRNKEKFIGVVQKINKKYYFRADNLKIHTYFEVFDDKEIPENSKVSIEIINWGLRHKNRLPVCRIEEILGESGNPEVEILAVIKEFDLPLEFPENVLNEANLFDEKISENEIAHRKDLRDLFTITIDPISAKDFDDAISLIEKQNGELHLYVHIADVAHFIRFESALFYEAKNRGNSYYFPKKVIPMLPERLSNKLCSLRPDEDKYSITVLSIFSKDGNIKKQSVFESIIRSDFRLAYEEVDEYFEGKQVNMSLELAETLDVMRILSEILSLQKKERGYLKFDLPEVEYIYDDDGYVQDIVRTRETESHVLIENFMLIANEYIAKLLTKKAKSTLYRIHEEPEEKDLKNITEMLRVYKISFEIDKDLNKTWQNVLNSLPDERYHRVFDRLVLRSMKKAKYSTLHKVHFGLGLQTYTHFTSPIRRFCDLIVHMQLKQIIFTTSRKSYAEKGFNHIDQNEKEAQAESLRYKSVTKAILDPTLLFDYAGIATEKEAIADDAERLMETKVITSFMKNNIGKTYSAIINGISPSNIFIELDDLPVKGVIKLNQLNDDFYTFDERAFQIKGKRRGRVFKLCDSLNVILVGVADELVFDVINKSNKTEKNRNKKENWGNLEERKKLIKERIRMQKKRRR